jgi:beta-glucosidase
MPGDITFNSGTSWWGANLTAFVNNGSIAESRLDDMATRIVAGSCICYSIYRFLTDSAHIGWYLLHQDENSYPAVNFNAFDAVDPATNDRVDVQEDHYKWVGSSFISQL